MQFYDESTIFFAYSLSIYNLFREWTMTSHFFHEFTLNPIFFSRNHYEFNIFFGISLWFHHLFREFTLNSLYTSRLNYEFTVDSLSFTRNPMTSLSASRFYYEFTICFATSISIHYQFRGNTLKLLSISRFNYKNTICFANSL